MHRHQVAYLDLSEGKWQLDSSANFDSASNTGSNHRCSIAHCYGAFKFLIDISNGLCTLLTGANYGDEVKFTVD